MIHLVVADLKRSLDFYGEVLGLKLVQEHENAVRLSADGVSHLLALTADPEAQPRPPRTAGLYHFAILVPSRLDLARSLHRILDQRYPLHGAADHLVSEAIYLADPDGNGIEISADRPRDQWSWEDDQLQMTTDELDLDFLLAELGRGQVSWEGVPAKTRIGHVHLHVADLALAERFYHEVLGFDVVRRYPEGATFLSAGGYHHHIGLNEWAGSGASSAQNVAGLKYFTICVPNEEELARLAEQLRQENVAFKKSPGMIALRDPFDTGIVITTGGNTNGLL